MSLPPSLLPSLPPSLPPPMYFAKVMELVGWTSTGKEGFRPTVSRVMPFGTRAGCRGPLAFLHWELGGAVWGLGVALPSPTAP